MSGPDLPFPTGEMGTGGTLLDLGVTSFRLVASRKTPIPAQSVRIPVNIVRNRVTGRKSETSLNTTYVTADKYMMISKKGITVCEYGATQASSLIPMVMYPYEANRATTMNVRNARRSAFREIRLNTSQAKAVTRRAVPSGRLRTHKPGSSPGFEAANANTE
jgi:hypothetical protein